MGEYCRLGYLILLRLLDSNHSLEIAIFTLFNLPCEYFYFKKVVAIKQSDCKNSLTGNICLGYTRLNFLLLLLLLVTKLIEADVHFFSSLSTFYSFLYCWYCWNIMTLNKLIKKYNSSNKEYFLTWGWGVCLGRYFIWW